MNIDQLVEYFSNAAMDPSIDEDGHIYISEGLDFPLWVILDADNRRIILQTYAAMREIDAVDAHEFVNTASSSILMPNFYVISENQTTHYLYANYTLYYDDVVSSKSLIGAVRKFSEAYKYAATLDEDDYYLQ